MTQRTKDILQQVETLQEEEKFEIINSLLKKLSEIKSKKLDLMIKF